LSAAQDRVLLQSDGLFVDGISDVDPKLWRVDRSIVEIGRDYVDGKAQTECPLSISFYFMLINI